MSKSWGIQSGRFLVVLAGVSYFTSFLRERYLIQHALGTESLNVAVIAYAVAAIIGNLYAITLGLAWLDGRKIPRWASAFGAVAAVGLVLAAVAPKVGSLLILASLVFGYEYGRQRSAFSGRQHWALLAAVVSPASTLMFWAIFGTATVTTIVGGYAVGYFVQSAATWFAARGSFPNHQARTPDISIIWPALWATLTLGTTYLDRILYITFGGSWSGASSFSLNLAQAAVLVIAGPLASEALAGRISNRPSIRFMAVSIVFTLIAMIVTPFLLPNIISGGQVSGSNYRELQDLTLIYMTSIPAAGYWSFRARALQSGSHMWMPMVEVVGIMLAVHILISGVAIALGSPLWVAVGFSLSTWLGAVLVSGSLPNKIDRCLQSWVNTISR